jgi:CHAT domain-containing protein
MPRTFISVFFAVLLALLLTGCAYSTIPERQRLMVAARYGDLARSVNLETCKNIPVSTARLFPVCIAQSKLKQYDQLFNCIECLEGNIKNGDRVYLDVEEMARLNPLSDLFADIRSRQEQFRIQFDIREYPHLLRAEAYIDLGNYQRAVEEAKKGLRSIPRGGVLEVSSEIEAHGLLGLAYALMGDRPNALKALSELEAVNTGGGIGKGPANQIFKPDQNIGAARIHMALGDFAKALEAMQRDDAAVFRSFVEIASGASLESAGLWTFQQLPKKFMLNKCLLETGSTGKAKQGLDELLATALTQDNNGIYWIILFDRGRIAEKEGKLAEAVEFYRKAVDVIEMQRSTINTEASKIGFTGDKQVLYQHLVTALHALGNDSAAFEYVERSKSRALVDMLAAKQDFRAKTTDQQGVGEALSLTAATDRAVLLQDLALNNRQTRGLLVSKRERVIAQSPELASLISVTAPKLPEIQAALSADELLIEYYYTQKELLIFVVSAKSLHVRQLQLGNLAEDIQQFQKQIQSSRAGEQEALSKRLYHQLIRPIEGHIDRSKLIIVPHGALHYLPFMALADGKSALIDRFSIRTLPSASVLKQLKRAKTVKTADILVFGNPDLGDPRYDLAHAESEATAVARTVPRSKLLLRKEANLAAFRKYGGDFSYIHFATHGQFQAEAPLKSAILLTRDRDSDGMLTVDSLYSTSLNADLVTLSACDTGLGAVRHGDDLIGLVRGFLYAGSGSIIASLWNVDDLATSYLMTEFYSNLKSMNKQEALRQAQLATRKKYAAPFFWAAFQLTGKGN